MLLKRNLYIQIMSTSDILDKYHYDPDNKIGVVNTLLTNYGGRKQFDGKIQIVNAKDTTRIIYDVIQRYSLEPNAKKVLIINGDMNTDSAIFSSSLGIQAMEYGWSGVIVLGAVRHSQQLSSMNIGVMALKTCPKNALNVNYGIETDEIDIDGEIYKPGDHLYADEDGIIIVRN